MMLGMLFAMPPVSYVEKTVFSKEISVNSSLIPNVPFYSQFKDISSTAWQKKGCGIASLAMIINYYKPQMVSVNKLLNQGIQAGAYLNNAGWIHSGLISLSNKYGMSGSTRDYSKLSSKAAFNEFKELLKTGPVIASVHYKFDVNSKIPHLVVIDGVKDGMVYYNDPAASGGLKKISAENFIKAWKKRAIVVRPSKLALR
jgi:ABC-type bacteriocin/lantibiotic exporter with double-glycine peptidase domain